MNDLKLNEVCRGLFMVSFAKESNDPCQSWLTSEIDTGVASICQRADGSLHARFTRSGTHDLEAIYKAEHGGYSADGEWADRDTLRGLELLVLKQYRQLNFVLGTAFGAPDDWMNAKEPNLQFTADSFSVFNQNIVKILPAHGFVRVALQMDYGLTWLEWYDTKDSTSVYRHALGQGADRVHFERAWARAILRMLHFMAINPNNR